MRNLNVCLHDVVADEAAVTSIYDITTEQLLDLSEVLRAAMGSTYDSYIMYFDDGYKSFHDIVATLDLRVDKKQVRCAVITDTVGDPDRLTWDEIKELSAQGYGFDAHGTSHAALAVFDDKALLATPSGGTYANSTRGTSQQLSDQEVLYQLVESKRVLEETLGAPTHDFVLPYGLYNEQTIRIAASQTNYRRLLTCHTALDTGQVLAPRLLVTQENCGSISRMLETLTSDFTTLMDPSYER